MKTLLDLQQRPDVEAGDPPPWLREFVTWAFPILTTLSAGKLMAAYPLVVDDTGTRPPGESEWVVSADASRTPPIDTLGANFSITAGLCPWIEGSMGFGYGWIWDQSRFSPANRAGPLDLTLGVKSPILRGDSAPVAFTLSAMVKLPTASASLGLGTGMTDLTVLAIATRSWGALSLDLNAGYTWTGVGDRYERTGDSAFSGAALRWQASPRLMVFVETYASPATEGNADLFGTLRTGYQLELVPHVLIGGAIGTGYGPGLAQGLVSVGLTIVY